MTVSKRILVACYFACALLWIEVKAEGQTADQTNDQSLIFPSLAARQKIEAARPSQNVVKQNSPIRQSVFDQADSAGPMIGPQAAVNGIGEPPMNNGAECCPGCGRPLDHPIMGTCDNCMGPGRRLLCLLRPRSIFGGHEGPVIPHEPWINRPFSVGVFVGPIVGSPLIDDWVGQQTGTLAGLRLGLDMDDDWGMELRFATANIPVFDSDAAIEAQRNMTGLPLPAPLGTRNADQFIWDIDFLYYPWGDASFRPYLLFGLGTDRIKFTDRLGTNYARILLGMPVGLGVKTRLNDWLIFRLEVTDNMALAGGSVFQAQQNVSITGAFEVRLGRSRIQYWPWNPGR